MGSSSVGRKEAPEEAPFSRGMLNASLCAVCQFLRGSLAGAMAKTAVYPLDRLKMRLQVKNTAAGVTFSLRQLPYELMQLVRNEGFLSLWKGNSSALCRYRLKTEERRQLGVDLLPACRAFPHSGIVYFSFEHYLKFLENLNGGQAKINRLIAGAAAGLTSTCVTYPLDVLNTRMSVTKHRLSYRQVAMLKHDGLVSVYRGFVPTLLGIMPYASISFFTFETLKQHFRDRNQAFTTTNAVVCGGFAGAIGQTVTYPLDTVRKLMQANTLLFSFQEDGHTGTKHPSIVESIRHVYRLGGIRGFYNGASLCWVKGFAAAGISFTLNESFRGALEGTMCAP